MLSSYQKLQNKLLDRHELLNDKAFLESLYIHLLQRPADEEGLAFYLEALQNKTMTRADIANSLANSQEAYDLILMGKFNINYYAFLNDEYLLATIKNTDILGFEHAISDKIDNIYHKQEKILNMLDNLGQQFNANTQSVHASTEQNPGTSSNNQPFKILIDMQGAQAASRDRGVGRYALSLVKALIKQSDNYEVYLLLNEHFPDTLDKIYDTFSSFLNPQNFITWRPQGPLTGDNVTNRILSEDIYERTVIGFNPDFFLIINMFESHGYGNDAVTRIDWLKYTDISVSCVLHDLIPLLNPEMHLTQDHVRQWYFEKVDSLNNCDILFAISESARQEGVENLNLDPENIINISSSINKEDYYILHNRKGLHNYIEDKFSISKPFIMYTAGGDERKNVKGLIEAFSLLPSTIQKQYNLVIVFDLDEQQKATLEDFSKNLHVEQSLILTGFVSHEDLVILYNLASLFVFPSLHEGFGLPVLEAMLCGCPTIASNNSSLPEVMGNLDHTFDPTSPQSIANKIQEALTDKLFYSELQQHAIKQPQNFSMDKSAVKLVNALESHIRYQKIKNKIYLDISELAQRDAKSGIQRVVKALIHEFVFNQFDGLDVHLVYAKEDLKYYHALDYTAQLFGATSQANQSKEVVFNYGDKLYLVDYAPGIQQNLADFYAKLRHQGIEIITLVHDILPLIHPEWWGDTRDNRRNTAHGFERWLGAVKQTNGAICVSSHTKHWLTKWLTENCFDIAPREFFVSVVHNGANIDKAQPSKGLPDDFHIIEQELTKRATFIMVGTLEPRKGHAEVLQVFEQLWDKSFDYNLVIVGKKGWLVDDLLEQIDHHDRLNENLFVFQGISDEFLEKLYGYSNALIAASYDEGFGLPIIEAAAYHIPVIARDIPVFREVAGDSDAVLYFDQDQKSLLNLLIDFATTNHQATNDQQTQYLTWQQSADQHKAIICGKNREYITIDDRLSYWANNSRIGSIVGEIEKDGIKTTQQAGCLIYGPYFPLAKGSWKVIITLTNCAHIHLSVNICYNQASMSLSSTSYTNSDSFIEKDGDFILILPIEVKDDIKDLEVVIDVDEASDFTVKRVEFSID